MSLFGKLKENINHGGVKLQLQAPASASMSDANVPVTVSVTATDQQHNIERISVTIKAKSINQTFSNPENNNSIQHQEHTIARSEYSQPFVLMPGETKSVNISIAMSQGQAAVAQMPGGGGVAQVVGAFQKLQAISETLSGVSWQYFIEASAKLEGVTFGPSHEQPIEILKV